MEIENYIKGKVILITGGSGSLGQELTKRFLEMGPKEIRIFSRSEKTQYEMKKKFPQCSYWIGDVRDYSAVREVVRGVDAVYHCAALKYINISEMQPEETVKSNIIGSMNIINAVKDEKNVELCIGISTDKACAPINIYGMSKAIMEKLFVNADKTKGDIKTRFAIARYGNVVGTNGSVIPFWKEKCDKGEDLPITDPSMTRFMFPLSSAIELIFYTTLNAKGGEIIAKEMSSLILGDLAEVRKHSMK
jgi:FlaA1/EpsC-like NDP-sugar epimerase